MNIRQVKKNDAKAMISLFACLDSETTFMLIEPGERKTSILELEADILSFSNSQSKMMAVAEIKGHIAGFIVSNAGTVSPAFTASI